MVLTASLLAILTSFFTTALIGIIIVPILKRLKVGQSIKEIGPIWHASKSGTPTMGGVLFIIGIIVAVVAAYGTLQMFSDHLIVLDIKDVMRLWSGIFCSVGFGLIGLVDDYIKVVKKRNKGLSAIQKTLFQFIVVLVYFFTLVINNCLSTVVDIPFFGQVNFGNFYYVISILGIYGVVNAVNLTDGVDGLASSVTAVYAIVFMIISNCLQFYTMNILAAALCGGCLGFLVWNFYPAKVFMGDTGSMFLGGMVVSLGFGTNQPILILIVGIIYIVEAMSVVIQVISFKTTGKRVFKMSPIHHHFEMCGWSEVKIVMAFSAVTAIFGCVAVLLI